MSDCQKGPFLVHALSVQRAYLPASTTTVLMLEGEYRQHLDTCDPCLSALLTEYAEIHGSTEHCQSCGEDCEEDELSADDNDLCPHCGKQGGMTTLYGPHRVKGYIITERLCWNCGSEPDALGNCEHCGTDDAALSAEDP